MPEYFKSSIRQCGISRSVPAVAPSHHVWFVLGGDPPLALSRARPSPRRQIGQCCTTWRLGPHNVVRWTCSMVYATTEQKKSTRIRFVVPTRTPCRRCMRNSCRQLLQNSKAVAKLSVSVPNLEIKHSRGRGRNQCMVTR